MKKFMIILSAIILGIISGILAVYCSYAIYIFKTNLKAGYYNENGQQATISSAIQYEIDQYKKAHSIPVSAKPENPLNIPDNMDLLLKSHYTSYLPEEKKITFKQINPDLIEQLMQANCVNAKNYIFKKAEKEKSIYLGTPIFFNKTDYSFISKTTKNSIEEINRQHYKNKEMEIAGAITNSYALVELGLVSHVQSIQNDFSKKTYGIFDISLLNDNTLHAQALSKVNANYIIIHNTDFGAPPLKTEDIVILDISTGEPVLVSRNYTYNDMGLHRSCFIPTDDRHSRDYYALKEAFN